MTGLLTVLFVAVACFAFGYLFAELVSYIVGVFRTRGEVAEAPALPRTKACPLNATPHFCCDPAAPLPSVPVGTGESLARELSDYLKGSA